MISNDVPITIPNQKNQWIDNCLTIEQANDLQKHFIMPLTLSQQSTSSRNSSHLSSSSAKYHCTICNYFCHNIDGALKHKQNSNHIKYLKVRPYKKHHFHLLFHQIFLFRCPKWMLNCANFESLQKKICSFCLII